MHERVGAGGSGRGLRRAALRASRWWAPAYVAVVTLMFAMWAVASPVGGVPDEPAHVVKAASIWQGQLRGPTRPLDPERLPLDITAQLLRTPATYAEVQLLTCHAFHPETPASCAPAITRDREVVGSLSAAGPYPPAFYALVGWPTRLVSAPLGVHLMRLTSVAACAALVALALHALRRRAGDALAFVAVTAALTPQVGYLAGSVNPNGLEIVGALALWAGLAAVLGARLEARATVVDGGAPDEPAAPTAAARLRAGDVAAAIAGAATLGLSRSLGPLFTLAIVAAVVVAHGRPVLSLRRDRAVLGVLACIGAIVALGAAWVVTSGHLSSVPGGAPEPGRSLLEQLLARIDDWTQQMIAVFGWLDTGPVLTSVWAWLAMLAAVLALVWVGVRSWMATCTLALVPLVALAPVVLQYPGADEQGIAWQGRYGLALAVGIPVLSALALAGAGGRAPAAPAGGHVVGRLAVAVGALAAIAHVAAFATAMRRYAVGVFGPLRFWRVDGAWAPPLGNLVTLALFVVLSVALAASGVSAAAVARRSP